MHSILHSHRPRNLAAAFTLILVAGCVPDNGGAQDSSGADETSSEGAEADSETESGATDDSTTTDTDDAQGSQASASTEQQNDESSESADPDCDEFDPEGICDDRLPPPDDPHDCLRPIPAREDQQGEDGFIWVSHYYNLPEEGDDDYPWDGTLSTAVMLPTNKAPRERYICRGKVVDWDSAGKICTFGWTAAWPVSWDSRSPGGRELSGSVEFDGDRFELDILSEDILDGDWNAPEEYDAPVRGALRFELGLEGESISLEHDLELPDVVHIDKPKLNNDRQWVIRWQPPAGLNRIRFNVSSHPDEADGFIGTYQFNCEVNNDGEFVLPKMWHRRLDEGWWSTVSIEIEERDEVLDSRGANYRTWSTTTSNIGLGDDGGFKRLIKPARYLR